MLDWDRVPSHEISPGFHGRFLHSATMTFALWDITQGAPLTEHHHPHEQVVQVFSGDFELTVDGTPYRLNAGSIFVIPPNAVHSGKALTDCRILDTFHPRREDYVTLANSK